VVIWTGVNVVEVTKEEETATTDSIREKYP